MSESTQDLSTDILATVSATAELLLHVTREFALEPSQVSVDWSKQQDTIVFAIRAAPSTFGPDPTLKARIIASLDTVVKAFARKAKQNFELTVRTD